MVFFGKKEAVVKIKSMCCFFEVLNVAVVVVVVTLILFVQVICNCIYVCFFFFVSDFCCSPSLADVMERAGTRGCTIYYTWLLLEGICGLRLNRRFPKLVVFLYTVLILKFFFNFWKSFVAAGW